MPPWSQNCWLSRRRIKAENAVLAVRATQARAATVGIHCADRGCADELDPAPEGDILGEMINTSAEILSGHVLALLPIEKAVTKAQTVASEVKEMISRSIDAVALGMFTVQASRRLAFNGTQIEEVKNRINEETRRFTAAREEVARAARESARRARGR